MKNLIVTIICISLCVIPLISKSQPQAVSMPNLTGVIPGTIVDIPVWGKYWGNIASCCIVIDYNTASLTYNGHNSLSSLFAGGFPIFNVQGSEIKFVWFSLTPISFITDTIFHLNFNYLGGCGDLNFNVDTTLPNPGCYFPIANNGGVNCPNGTNDETIAENAIHIFPNPTCHELKVEFNVGFLQIIKNIKVFDQRGSLLYHKEADCGSSSFMINDLDLSPGEYILNISTVKGQGFSKTFIVY